MIRSDFLMTFILFITMLQECLHNWSTTTHYVLGNSLSW
jgi:hypothetical protein